MTITNITMRDINSAPIFIRLGSRLRGPKGTQVGAVRRVNISNIVCSNSTSEFGCILSGIPGHPIEDVTISNIYIQHRGGGTKEQAALTPPEKEAAYPDPAMFGAMPSQGFFIRHPWMQLCLVICVCFGIARKSSSVNRVGRSTRPVTSRLQFAKLESAISR